METSRTTMMMQILRLGKTPSKAIKCTHSLALHYGCFACAVHSSGVLAKMGKDRSTNIEPVAANEEQLKRSKELEEKKELARQNQQKLWAEQQRNQQAYEKHLQEQGEEQQELHNQHLSVVQPR